MVLNIKNNILLLVILLFLTSCRTEKTELIQTSESDAFVVGAYIAELIQRTSSNDGSEDNIIDYANCFNIKLPISTTVNGLNIDINTKEDYKIVEYIFDEDEDDTDIISLHFPITIIQKDFSEVEIDNQIELSDYSKTCNGENESDDDIECLDFQYPITGSIFNSKNEVIDAITLDSDANLFQFINNLDNDDLVALNFPISVILFDNSNLEITSLTELANTIEAYDGGCDEDDDYDYNDDDCDDCNTEDLITKLTGCTNWYVDRLERNHTNYNNIYDGYYFNFSEDGTISVFWNDKSAYGTWIASGETNNIAVTIDIPDLPSCNNSWILSEIAQYNETKIDLRVGNGDRLRYKNNCD